jgi:hypothetical protein
LSTKWRESLMVLMGQRESGGGGETESHSGHPPPHASGAGGHTAPRRAIYL